MSEEKKYRDIIADLKTKSGYYPNVIIKKYVITDRVNEGPATFISSLIRIYREEKWYVVHCVENAVLNKLVGETDLLKKFMQSAYKIQQLYLLTGKYEDVDKLQTTEEERLLL